MTLPKIGSVRSDAVVLPGDNRGSYGFGRPAHASDPLATYHFEAGGIGMSRIKEHCDDIAPTSLVKGFKTTRDRGSRLPGEASQ